MTNPPNQGSDEAKEIRTLIINIIGATRSTFYSLTEETRTKEISEILAKSETQLLDIIRRAENKTRIDELENLLKFSTNQVPTGSGFRTAKTLPAVMPAVIYKRIAQLKELKEGWNG